MKILIIGAGAVGCGIVVPANNSINHQKILSKLKQAEDFDPSAVSNGTGRNYTIPDEKHNRFYVPFICFYIRFLCVYITYSVLFIPEQGKVLYHFIYFFIRTIHYEQGRRESWVASIVPINYFKKSITLLFSHGYKG